MAQEIERKFLVKGPFRERAFASSRICQGYICSERGRTVRVRLRDNRGYLTIKGPSFDGGLSRYEFETEISEADARELLKLCGPVCIEKTRHLVRQGNHVFEVDEFHGANEGLVVAEVELARADEPYEKPDFIGEEVTGDRRYYNSSLMMHPYCEWGDIAAR